MFNIGDLILYSTHGICRIDDICKKTFSGITKSYYVLHPMEDCNLSISTPVDNDKVVMIELLTKEEALKILESFKLPGIEWIEADGERNQKYSSIVKQGDRKEIAKIANTLMKKKISIEDSKKKFHERDKKLLTSIENILFEELAFILGTTAEEINEQVLSYISESEY